ncbi:MAG: TIGR04086 family membrane protein [Clostridia bacterium]|nr:TIGR04086 family membrane protein [Clostridia bacterium]
MTLIKRVFIILRSIAISYFISLLMLMVFALLLAYTNISESTIPIVTFVVSLVSVFIGSSIAMIKIRENGLINGGLVGLIYVLVLYVLSSIFVTGFGLNGFSFSMIIFNVLIGMIGGIIGVNMIKEERIKR